ncbi:MAG: SpoIIIAH-like family protein [Bacilli bacterium]|nr:SpoIIIAH-like family protein [Bacilli bacterium]
MNKHNLWFLTLFSLVLVLGIYYVTMPNELLLGSDATKTTKTEEKVKTTVSTSSTIEAMRVSLEEERTEKMAALQQQLTSDKITTEEKNNAYEQLKYLNELQGKEEGIEKKLKEKLNLSCFVKIDNSNVSTVCISSKHDSKLANDVMRLIQAEYDNKMYITVKFEKK